MSPRLPKGKKGLKRKLREQKAITTTAVKTAMLEASKALDQQIQEIAALKRIIISERAELIFYTEKYQACLQHKCLDIQPVDFKALPEAERLKFTKRAVCELSGQNDPGEGRRVMP